MRPLKRAPSRARYLPGVGAAVALAVGLALSACSPGPAGVSRVVVVGVDGLDWRVLEPLLAEGALPNLKRFLASGSAGRLETLLPTYSPIIWASIATGKSPEKHGIRGFGRRDPAEPTRIIPYTSNLRRVKALWNVLGERGLRVAVVGWWTTWPVEAVNGVMVSDRLAFTRMNLWLGLPHRPDELPAQVHPPERSAAIRAVAELGSDPQARFFESFFPGSPTEAMKKRLYDPHYELFLAWARDETYRQVLEQVRSDGDYDFLAYYLNGTDIASHHFWKHRFPEEWPDPIPADELSRFGDVIERYYAYADRTLAPLLELASPECVVILVSDHGFVTGRRPDSPNISGTHYRSAPPGVIALAGGTIPPGGRDLQASVLDVAPTVLHLLGQPVARDMDGAVLDVARDPERGVAWVETWEDGSAAPTAPIPSAQDEVILERLRALGYLDSPDAVD